MKKIIAVIAIVTLCINCKKTINNTAQDAVVSAMVNGQWAVTIFTQNGTDITSSFSGYKFQFFSNMTVAAIDNGIVVQTGTWNGNATTMTTSANFPNAVNPLLLINGTWNIINSGLTFVIASQVNGTQTKTMRLDKQ